MYKAIRAYTDNSASSHTLTFDAGDTLYVLEETNETWWYVSNSSGKVGYVLASYLTAIEKVSLSVCNCVISKSRKWA